MSKSNPIYTTKNRFGMNKNHHMIDIFQNDLKYINSEGMLAQPDGLDPEEYLMEPLYLSGANTIIEGRKHTKLMHKEQNERLAEIPKFQPEVDYNRNYIAINSENMVAWGLNKGRRYGGNLKQIKKSENTSAYFNIYNRRINDGPIQVDGHRWLYERDAAIGEPKTKNPNCDFVKRDLGIKY